MLRDEAISRIQRRLGFRSDLVSAITEAIQDAQMRAEDSPTLPWFLITEVSSITTTIGEERVQLPSDFLREYEDDALYYFNAAATDDADKWVELPKDDLDFLRRKYPGSGAPKAYTIAGDYFRIFPTPDAVYTLKSMYYQADLVLTDNVENLWLKHAPFMLINDAGNEIAADIGNKEAAAKFASGYQRALLALAGENEARKHENRRYVMGGNN